MSYRIRNPEDAEELEEGNNIIFSNLVWESRQLFDRHLVHRLLQNIDLNKIDLKVLDEVFSAFLKSFNEIPKYKPEDFSNIHNSQKYG
jgi:hypothetical protein